MSYYKYYKYYNGETSRPDWLVYVDHLIAIGRSYPSKKNNIKDYEYLNEQEYRKLVSLLFQDNTLCEREEIMLSHNKDELTLVVSSFVENDNSLSEKRVITMIIQNIVHYFETIIEELFEQIRTEQGTVSHE